MQRRKFLRLGITTTLVMPFSLAAIDYRAKNPEAWTAHTVDDAITALYGEIKLEESKKISIITPKVAASGANVSVKIKTDLSLKSLALFQDTNPESAVAVFTVHSHEELHYSVKIKMAKSGNLTVVGQGVDGKYYQVTQKIEVAQTSCEG